MSFGISKVAVIGAGQMGSGIAQVAASSGFQVLMNDLSKEALDKGLSQIKRRLLRQVEKGTLNDPDPENILKNISLTTALDAVSEAQIVIEAVAENSEIKQKLFSQISEICPNETLLASNTSSISITKLASTICHPGRFIGLHFMNPVPVMSLVEVIRGLQTDEQTYNSSIDFVKKLNKTPVTAKHDYPGFLVNRILVPWLNEAFFVLQEDIGTPEDIDTAMKLGTNVPMGPFELADFIGLDTCLAIMEIFLKEFGDSKYRPCPLLVKYVEAGRFGKKSGRGVYDYEVNK